MRGLVAAPLGHRRGNAPEALTQQAFALIYGANPRAQSAFLPRARSASFCFGSRFDDESPQLPEGTDGPPSRQQAGPPSWPRLHHQQGRQALQGPPGLSAVRACPDAATNAKLAGGGLFRFAKGQRLALRQAKTIAVSIEKPAAAVYDFLADPHHYPKWAPGNQG